MSEADENKENKAQEPKNEENHGEKKKKKDAKPSPQQSGVAPAPSTAPTPSPSPPTEPGSGGPPPGGGGSADKLERTKRNMSIYLLASLAALIVIGASTYFMKFDNTLVKTIVYVGVSGGIGGVLYSVRGFIYHNETGDFKETSKWAILYQPVTGFIAGVLVYFLIVGGLLTFTSSTNVSSATNYSKGILFYCGIAFLAGFGTKKFNEKLDELASTIFSAGPDSSSAAATSGASTLALSGLQDPATAGKEGSIKVTAQTSDGKVAKTYTGTVKLNSDDSAASLPPSYTFQESDKGVYTFQKVVFNTLGDHTITATDTADSSITGSHKVKVKAAAP